MGRRQCRVCEEMRRHRMGRVEACTRTSAGGGGREIVSMTEVFSASDSAGFVFHLAEECGCPE